ncbi:MAG: EscU/YscU/HrcU family type III secretion system export apparatus switch protein [Pseudomonadota bacterium]
MTDKKQEEEKKALLGEAVALKYDATEGDLPRIVARGEGALAEELVRLALEHNIPIKYDPDLVRMLSHLDEGRAIPEEAFVLVAELLSFIYLVNQEYRY